VRGNMYRTHFASEIAPEMEGKEVQLAGWVHLIRDLGGKKFVVLRDKTGQIQIVFDKSVSRDAYNSSMTLSMESCISIRGVVKLDRRAPKGVEVHVKSLIPLSFSKAPLPLDVSGKVEAEIDTRLRERVLDLRRAEMQAVLKIQDTVLKSFREFFRSKGFIEVFTPKIIASATEGGAQLFPVIYFGREAFLAQSPQLYKELLAGAIERVFEIAPAWRAEESDTPYHLSEFISIDIESAFMNYEEVMRILEEAIKYTRDKVVEENKAELKVLRYNPPDVNIPITRVSYTEALEILKAKGLGLKFGDDLSTPELRILNEELKTPIYFITEWPSESRPFYTKRKESDPRLSESFDLIYKWIEISSGSTRNHKREDLEEEIKRRGLNPSNFEFYLKWFDYGMPPHAGWAIGLARFMLMVTGLNSVKEVVPFPRDKKRLTP
jgi:aspartyl-tRNA synthetase, archaeal type